MFSTAGEDLFSWRAATKMHFEAEFGHGDGEWVALPPKAASPRATGTFNVVSESKFVLRETEGGVIWAYQGNHVPSLNGMAMRLTLDKSGRAALAKKIMRTVQPVPRDRRVTIESISVHLNTVSQPLLNRPKADEKQKVWLSGTGTYRVVWRYDWVWPLPTYYGSSTWRFDFRESLVVGPGQ